MRQQRQLDRWQEGWEGSSSKEQESRVMDGEEEGGGVAQEVAEGFHQRRGGQVCQKGGRGGRGDNGW